MTTTQTNILRPDQAAAIDQVAQKIAQGKKRIIFQLATGGGKTVAFSGLINRYMTKQKRKVFILVHREELLKQARRTLYNWYDIAAAPIVAGNKFIPDVPVYVGMVETINNRIKKNPRFYKNMGLVIVDECHIGNFKKLYDFFDESWIIGFSATPISSSKKDPLKNYFEDIVCGISIPELIEQGSLVPNHTINVFNINRNQLTIKNGEFDDVEMGHLFSGAKHIQNCVAAYQQHAKGLKTLIFNVNIEHSKKVNATFEAFGYNCRHLDSECTPAYRHETLEWFRNTPDAILNNVGILTTGFDEPSIQCIIPNKGTKSLPLWLQMCGRGSRPHPGKDQFLILDLGDNASELGDWCEPHDWNDLFFNPQKARASEDNEAPSKICISCDSIIPAAARTCKYCGAQNPVKEKPDALATLRELVTRRPINIDVKAMIDEYAAKRTKDGKPFKDMSLLHGMKYQIIMHASRIWKLRRIDDQTAGFLLKLYQSKVKEWCELKGHNYDWWHQKSSRDWILSEMKRVFKWEPNEQTQRA